MRIKVVSIENHIFFSHFFTTLNVHKFRWNTHEILESNGFSSICLWLEMFLCASYVHTKRKKKPTKIYRMMTCADVCRLFCCLFCWVLRWYDAMQCIHTENDRWKQYGTHTFFHSYVRVRNRNVLLLRFVLASNERTLLNTKAGIECLC